jgi:hypothetical protein
MSRLNTLTALAAVMTTAPVAFAQSGGPYEITAWTIDGGGIQNASGGGYTLSGTIGQPDAGPRLSGGSFDLDGGFWPAALAAGGCPADLAAPFGVLNFFDVLAFLGSFNAQSPDADIAAPIGSLNFFDVLEYLSRFNAGCP